MRVVLKMVLLRPAVTLLIAATLSACSGVSPREVEYQNARSACVQLGLQPESSEVGDCAAKLRAAISRSGQE